MQSEMYYFTASEKVLFLSSVALQFLSDGTTQLFQLLLDCRECDTKMKVLNVLSLLMERMGVAIQPHVSALLQHMPQLWAESEHQSASMLRCVILSTLTNITRSLGPVSAQLHSFALPIIQFATDVNAVSVRIVVSSASSEVALPCLHFQSPYVVGLET